MIFLYILIGLLLLIVGLLFVRIGIRAEYAQSGLSLKGKVGPVWCPLFPREGKQAEKKKPEKEASSKPFGGSLELFRALFPVVIDGVKLLSEKVRIDDLEMDLIWGDPDPARCAVGYGAANAVAGMIWPQIEQNFQVKNYHIHTDVDFNAGKPTVYMRVMASMRVGQCLSFLLHAGKPALDVYRQFDSKKKHNPITQEKEAV